jgi:hypothetical protein
MIKMLEDALADIIFISSNLDTLSDDELKLKLKNLERELRESVLQLKRLRLEVLDNITEI